MHRSIIVSRCGVFLAVLLIPVLLRAEEPTVSRIEGFLLLWEPIHRSIEDTRETPFQDISKNHPDFKLLTFAKARGILNEESEFYPEEPLRLNDGLLWLLRTRNVESPDAITYDTVASFAKRYNLLSEPDTAISENAFLTQEELSQLMQALDTFLKEEKHIVSFYAEEFAGEGTAFGETFDPSALTAAHRTLPHNTLVRVTAPDANCQLPIANCPKRSVVVRINDRGPYAEGRDMDLSLAAFEALAPRSRGVLSGVTFERLGSTDVLSVCLPLRSSEGAKGGPIPTYQKRLGGILLDPGIPKTTSQGTILQLSANRSFRLLQMKPPKGRIVRKREWTRRGESLELHFEQEGTYMFIFHSDDGLRRRFRTVVTEKCSEVP